MDDTRQPLLEHLAELRKRLRNAAIALIIATCITFWWSQELYVLLARPLIAAWRNAGLGGAEMNFRSLTEPFWVYFELALWSGVFLASPFIFHQIWRFIAPGLYAKEKRIAVPFAVTSALCFIGGAAFCYAFVLPAAFKFFLSYASANASRMKSVLGFADLADPMKMNATLFMSEYLDLTTRFMLGFGLVFELPLLIFFLSMIGLVTHRSLWKFNKYAVVLAFVIGGVLTPGPDAVSQLLMAGPLIVLYNISILVAYVVTKRREAATTAQPAAE